MDIDAIDEQKKQALRAKQYKEYQEQLDQLDAEKKQSGSISGKKATVLPSDSSPILNLFSKITKQP
jgi:hypothetical protein